MADNLDISNLEGPGLDPPPDPWAPPRANAAQAASIGLGGAGAALLGGSQPSPDTIGNMIALLPDPTQLFGRMAHLLGFQFDASAAWTWGLVLVILSVVVNIYSYFLRYRYATWVKPKWDAQLAALQRNQAVQQQAATSGARGFVSGDA